MESPEEFFNRYYKEGRGDYRCERADLNFHIDWIFNMEVKILCPTEDWMQNKSVILLLPKKYRSDFTNMLKFGFTLNEAYETLKETYGF